MSGYYNQNPTQATVRIQTAEYPKITYISGDLNLNLYFFLNLPYEEDAGSKISCIFILYKHITVQAASK